MNGIEKDALEYLVGLKEQRIVDVDGVKYSTHTLADLRKAKPVVAPLRINTLDGIVAYLTNNVDGADKTKLMLHVHDESHVSLISKVEGHFRQRETLIDSYFESLMADENGLDGFAFGSYHDLETMVISLQTLFEDTPERNDVIKLFSGVRDEKVNTSDDDGVSQTVTARHGIVLGKAVKVPNPIALKPFRTFREVAQPSSLFVLRLQAGDEGELPQAALFEANGGKWKLDAIKNISEYLAAKVSDVAIIR